MTTIGFVRHGTTLWNKQGRAQGNSDVPLDAQGIREAEQAAARLCTENWDVIYASDLTRAKQTAEAVARAIGKVELHVDKRIRERDCGRIEGMTEEERTATWGPDWRSLDLGLETRERMVERGMSFLDEVAAKHEGENILIVSHGTFLKQLLTYLIPEIDTQTLLANTSVSCITSGDDGWKLEYLNCTKHLEQIHK
ncbi:histidine phosphatase family protein [Lentibacillus cibarius]|uniref:Histidine phosphatase family protein n=1 Tax=Lentibacillus cibarius TaxID=2583219 RepID=A0A549YG14_9BACI|nr:histidine phosphatase family protein [Lentibacillus cibarius]TMN22039.1 histidine phosphatase family protein [Lentibacillus cibarius]TRM10815.1 histidine phosphatase family protein [Lentibacillus cibarius]